MKTMRERRRARGLRELRLVVADARSQEVRKRVAAQVGALKAARRARRARMDRGRFRARREMTRGDVVTVAAAGDYGKARPAVIVQSDAFRRTTRRSSFAR